VVISFNAFPPISGRSQRLGKIENLSLVCVHGVAGNLPSLEKNVLQVSFFEKLYGWGKVAGPSGDDEMWRPNAPTCLGFSSISAQAKRGLHNGQVDGVLSWQRSSKRRLIESGRQFWPNGNESALAVIGNGRVLYRHAKCPAHDIMSSFVDGNIVALQNMGADYSIHHFSRAASWPAR
jgi:hypothetical protein